MVLRIKDQFAVGRSSLKNMHYLVLVERFSPSSNCWPNLVAMNETGLPVEEVIKIYKCFGGVIVSVFTVTNSSGRSKSMINECIELKKNADCLLLHVISDPDEIEFMGKDQTTFADYEVGVLRYRGGLHGDDYLSNLGTQRTTKWNLK